MKFSDKSFHIVSWLDVNGAEVEPGVFGVAATAVVGGCGPDIWSLFAPVGVL